ncbi:MAG: efflux RND transporter periplasmic adaptor subunit [Acidobacteria bacterium]|nr:efflux RND transporter periplasmic adaptor subunit [Acidobacteriota bacterium]
MSAVPNPIPPAPEPLKPLIVTPSAEPPEKPKSPLGIVALVAGLAIGGYLLYQWMAKPSTDGTVFAAVKTAPITFGPVERRIRISGQTSAREFANITAPILQGPESRNTLVLTFLSNPGVPVKKGTVIAKIDGQWLVDHIDDVKDQVRQAENDVTKRRAEQAVETEQLQQTLRVAKANWDKAKLEFGAADVRSEVEKELLKLNMEEAEARFKQQSADVAQKRAAHAAEIKILELTVERQRRHLGRHENDILKYTITAPIDGLPVMQTIFRGGEMAQIGEGDTVFPGQPFMKVVNQKTMQLEGQINQAESSEIRLGQDVYVGIDSFPDLKMRGKVAGVNALATARGGNFIRAIPVRVQLLDIDKRVIPDLSAYGDVVVQKTEDVLRAPVAALTEDDGKSFLFVKTPQQTFEKREVTTGLRSHTEVAITSGLKAGDQVRLN